MLGGNVLSRKVCQWEGGVVVGPFLFLFVDVASASCCLRQALFLKFLVMNAVLPKL